MADAGPGLTAIQLAFAAHLRDPEHRPGPADVEDRRVRIYRELVFNNVSSLLAGNLPVIRRLLTDAHWDALVRDFFVCHRASSPLFHEIGQEFIRYLADEREAQPHDPPFLLELAHYEWVELALQLSDEQPDLPAIDPNGDLLGAPPALSPLAWPLSYRFPVHRIAPDFQPAEPPEDPTHLLVYRTRDDKVAFIETNAVTQRLLALRKEDPAEPGLELLKRIAAELHHPAPDSVIAFGAQLLDDLRARGVLLGTRRLAS